MTAAKKTPARAPRKRSTTRAVPRPDHDVVVFGATGFTGRLVAAHLAKHAPADTRIALAGRSQDKLEAVRADLGSRGAHLPLVVADSADRASLDALATATRTVISTVGPYGTYGLPLVGACAEAGTSYCDLTGEVLFMRDSIDQFDAAARKSGARIVHSCGFDSIPSDLGVMALWLAARHDDPEATLGRTRLIVRHASGGFSGGTVASGLAELDRAGADPAAAAVLADPYALSPDRAREPNSDSSDPRGVTHDDVVGAWLAPFLMGPINSRVVRRSNALADYRYGRQFRYAEYVATGSGLPGRALATGLAAGMLLGEAVVKFGPTRAVVERVLPAPGEGPSEAARAKGSFTILLHTRTAAGIPYRGKVAAQGDPGYQATARMLATTGLTLANDTAALPTISGVLTPATALGETLLTNLKVAGMTIEARRV